MALERGVLLWLSSAFSGKEVVNSALEKFHLIFLAHVRYISRDWDEFDRLV